MALYLRCRFLIYKGESFIGNYVPLLVIIDNRKAIARLSDFLCIFGTITVVVKNYIRV